MALLQKMDNFSMQLQEFCTWQEKSPQDPAGAATCRLSP